MVASIFLLVVTCFSPLALSSCGPPAVNAATVALIKQYEGFVASPKNDPSGYPTVGYGHKCEKKGCAEVTAKGYKFPLTQSTAASLLQADLKSYESCLAKDVGSAKLNANQYGALVSWTYNEGCGNVGSSTLVKRLKAGDKVDTVCGDELPKWTKSNGKQLPGLVKRRAAEVKLCKKASSAAALPAKKC